MLAVDDYGHAGHYSADLVLNQNLHATRTLYSVPRAVHPAYCWALGSPCCGANSGSGAAGSVRCHEAGRKVLVTLGGSDPAMSR